MTELVTPVVVSLMFCRLLVRLSAREQSMTGSTDAGDWNYRSFLFYQPSPHALQLKRFYEPQSA